MNYKDYLKLILLVTTSAILTGCQQPEPLKLNTLIENNTAGRSIEGRTIPCFSFGNGREVVLIMATIHGNENAGTPLSYKLIDYIREHPEELEDKKIVIMPVTNPDGFAANTRYNSMGIDLNRNFESDNRQNNTVNGHWSLSEPEAVFIKNILAEHKPDRIISLHESLACIDYDGPGRKLAEHLSKYCNLPVKKLGSKPGSLGSYAGDTLSIPIITLEMTNSDMNASAATLWRRYGNMLLAFIHYPEAPY